MGMENGMFGAPGAKKKEEVKSSETPLTWEQISNTLIDIAGDDSPEAWAKREEIIEKAGDDQDHLRVVEGLCGLDSDRAWTLREEFLGVPEYYNNLLVSISGVDSERAKDFRKKMDEAMEGIDRNELDLIPLTFTGEQLDALEKKGVKISKEVKAIY